MRMKLSSCREQSGQEMGQKGLVWGAMPTSSRCCSRKRRCDHLNNHAWATIFLTAAITHSILSLWQLDKLCTHCIFVIIFIGWQETEHGTRTVFAVFTTQPYDLTAFCRHRHAGTQAQPACPRTLSILRLSVLLMCRLGYKMVVANDGSGQVFMIPPGADAPPGQGEVRCCCEMSRILFVIWYVAGWVFVYWTGAPVLLSSCGWSPQLANWSSWQTPPASAPHAMPASTYHVPSTLCGRMHTQLTQGQKMMIVAMRTRWRLLGYQERTGMGKMRSQGHGDAT